MEIHHNHAHIAADSAAFKAHYDPCLISALDAKLAVSLPVAVTTHSFCTPTFSFETIRVLITLLTRSCVSMALHAGLQQASTNTLAAGLWLLSTQRLCCCATLRVAMRPIICVVCEFRCLKCLKVNGFVKDVRNDAKVEATWRQRELYCQIARAAGGCVPWASCVAHNYRW